MKGLGTGSPQPINMAECVPSMVNAKCYAMQRAGSSYLFHFLEHFQGVRENLVQLVAICLCQQAVKSVKLKVGGICSWTLLGLVSCSHMLGASSCEVSIVGRLISKCSSQSAPNFMYHGGAGLPRFVA
jgi:hypothetical protein